MSSHLVWAEVDLQAIGHNVRQLRRATRPEARLMAVVKANGYGHGAVQAAKTALRNGAEALGVARIQEGMALREAGLEAPVLVFGHTPAACAKYLLGYHLTQTVYSLEGAEALSAFALSVGKKAGVHIKVDTGMGRVGTVVGGQPCSPKDSEVTKRAVREVLSVARLSGLEVEGIYTHFAAADSADKSYATGQLETFLDFLDRLHKEGMNFPLRHAANSAALIDLPESHLDMVRPGISVYGLYPSKEVNKDRISLRPAMALKARIIHLKKVGSGFKVSYGMSHQTEKPTTIATVPVGYADGLSRILSSRGSMLVHGRKAPIVGRVCMDLTMLDVGGISDVAVGDEVVFFGEQEGVTIPAEEVALLSETIHYEVVSRISERVPRVYLD